MEYQKSILYWIPDSCGIYSCHINLKNLSFKQSFIAEVLYNANNKENPWEVHLKDNSIIGNYSSMKRAQKALEMLYMNTVKGQTNA